MYQPEAPSRRNDWNAFGSQSCELRPDPPLSTKKVEVIDSPTMPGKVPVLLAMVVVHLNVTTSAAA